MIAETFSAKGVVPALDTSNQGSSLVQCQMCILPGCSYDLVGAGITDTIVHSAPCAS